VPRFLGPSLAIGFCTTPLGEATPATISMTYRGFSWESYWELELFLERCPYCNSQAARLSAQVRTRRVWKLIRRLAKANKTSRQLEVGLGPTTFGLSPIHFGLSPTTFPTYTLRISVASTTPHFVYCTTLSQAQNCAIQYTTSSCLCYWQFARPLPCAQAV
jgi:hypothetical protein